MGKYATLWDQKQNGLCSGVFTLTSYVCFSTPLSTANATLLTLVPQHGRSVVDTVYAYISEPNSLWYM